MNLRTWLIVLAPLAALTAVSAAARAGTDDVVAQVQAAINKERADRHLPPIKVNVRLTKAAQPFAEFMHKHNLFSHTADGRSCGDRIKAAGYSFSSAGEIILKGASTAAGAVKGWMNSPGHRRAILGKFTEMGVGRSGPYWVVDFGKPR